MSTTGAASRGGTPAHKPQSKTYGAQASQTVRKTGSKSGSSSSAGKKRRRKKKSKAPIIALTAVVVAAAAITITYTTGYMYYKDKFTANTYVNGIDVSGKTFEEAAKLFEHEEVPDELQIARPSGEIVSISLDAVDYSYNYKEELDKIFNDIDRKSWFAAWLKQTDYDFTDVASYDKDKLYEELENADWGDIENQNAKLKSNDDGYYIEPEVQGDVLDIDIMKDYVAKCLDNGAYTVQGMDSDAYIQPDVVSEDYEKKAETLNKMWDVVLAFDFNYKKQKLTGKKLCSLISVKRDGSYTVNADKVEEYVEWLGEKYDTYNTERKFHATLQGDITVPTSSDAKYGWWLDQDGMCELVTELLEKGETNKKVEPVYYKQGNYEFTGMASARSADDDIGDTYVEVDLTAQQFWYYENGKQVRTGYIVSGQTTSEARTTLPGVYKVWYKATNYLMKGTNSDGDSWSVNCNYWTRVAIVGIGLHDSTWRGTAFGGSIYKTNGSHGCINMSLSDAKFIHDEVAMDTPVVMYY